MEVTEVLNEIGKAQDFEQSVVTKFAEEKQKQNEQHKHITPTVQKYNKTEHHL